ncbi:MAG: ferritin [Tannerella sp.]|jgi:ferritin|nr:ferritin [Tannerella sp.]
MLSQKMELALNQQANAELWSAYLYLSMSYDMDNKGYGGMAHWFSSQAKEEYGHSSALMKYITEAGGKVALQPIAEVKQVWTSPLDAFEDTLKHEQDVTAKFCKLMDLAVESKDYATQIKLQWFISEQVEEENTARNIIEKLKRIENRAIGLYSIDKKLGERQFIPEG